MNKNEAYQYIINKLLSHDIENIKINIENTNNNFNATDYLLKAYTHSNMELICKYLENNESNIFIKLYFEDNNYSYIIIDYPLFKELIKIFKFNFIYGQLLYYKINIYSNIKITNKLNTQLMDLLIKNLD